MKKALTFIAIFILCTHKVFAIGNFDTPVQKICPAGLFCTANGKYTVMQDGKGKNAITREDIEGYYKAPAELVVPGWGMWSDMRLCDECDEGDGSCAYCANHYDETGESLHELVKKHNITQEKSDRWGGKDIENLVLENADILIEYAKKALKRF